MIHDLRSFVKQKLRIKAPFPILLDGRGSGNLKGERGFSAIPSPFKRHDIDCQRARATHRPIRRLRPSSTAKIDTAAARIESMAFFLMSRIIPYSVGRLVGGSWQSAGPSRKLTASRRPTMAVVAGRRALPVYCDVHAISLSLRRNPPDAMPKPPWRYPFRSGEPMRSFR